MGHDHHRRAEAIAQLEDEVVQQLGADGVQARRRLVEEEDVGVERHGPGQAGALAHAAADLRGIELLEASQSDQRELQRDERSEEHTSELQSHSDLVCRLLLEKKKKKWPTP